MEKMDKKSVKFFKELLLKKKAELSKGIEHIAKDALNGVFRRSPGRC